MRPILKHTFLATAMMMAASGLTQAQSSEPPTVGDAVAAASLFRPSLSTSVLSAPLPSDPPAMSGAPSIFTPPALAALDSDAPLAQQPAGPPPTPRHTGIKALTKHLVTNFKYLPSIENLYWAGAGGG